MSAPRALVAAAAVVACVAAVAGAAWTTFPEHLDAGDVAFATAPTPPLTRRLAVVVVGSLRRDVVADPRLMPALVDARRRGSGGVAETSPVPMSASFARALTVGRPFSALDIVRDFSASGVPATSSIHQAVRAGRHVCLVGTLHLTSPSAGFAQTVVEVPFTSFRDLATGDDEAARRAAALLRQRRCDLLLVYLGSPDRAAHTHGGVSAEYRSMVRLVDGWIADLARAADAATTFLVASDHGTSDVGDHAVADQAIVRDAPFVLWGPGVVAGREARIRQVDLAPLLAALLGFALPPQTLGTVPVHLLDAPPAVRAELLARGLEQKTRYLETYARRYGRPLVLEPVTLPVAAARPVATAASDGLVAARLAALDRAYEADLGRRSTRRFALGAVSGITLVAFAALALATPATAPAASARVAVALAALALVPLLPAMRPEVGSGWGVLVLSLPVALAALAQRAAFGDVSLLSARALGAVAVGAAAALALWRPAAVDLPAFRPALFHAQPGFAALVVVAGAAAAAWLATATRGRSLSGLAHGALLGAAAALALFVGDFHDLVHWILAIAALGSAALVLLRRAPTAVLAAPLALALVLGVRRLRGLALGQGWGDAEVVGVVASVAAAAMPVVWLVLLRRAQARSAEPALTARVALPAALAALVVVAGVLRALDLQLVARWAHPALALLVAVVAARTPMTVRLPVALAAALASATLLFDPHALLALVIALGAVGALWLRVCRGDGGAAPVTAALLGFALTWLVFFATGNELDLTAINTLRRGILGSDAGAAGFSFAWTVALLALKLALVPVAGALLLGAAGRVAAAGVAWPRVVAAGAVLHVALVVAAYLRLGPVGYSAAGGVLLAAAVALAFLLGAAGAAGLAATPPGSRR